MTPEPRRWPPNPTLGQLALQFAAVAADVPLFLTAPLYRRWHLRWGVTPTEVSAKLPGDGLLPHAQFQCTRAITIAAPPKDVWPWLVQVGCRRGGFYSNDLLDNLGHPSAREIVAHLQHLEVGQWVPMSPTPSDDTALKVDGFEANRWLLWRKLDSTWAWTLTATDAGQTRLVTRVQAGYDWNRPAMAVLGVLLMELGDFAMMRRMLYGIKQRAEALHRDNTARVTAEPVPSLWSGGSYYPTLIGRAACKWRDPTCQGSNSRPVWSKARYSRPKSEPMGGFHR